MIVIVDVCIILMLCDNIKIRKSVIKSEKMGDLYRPKRPNGNKNEFGVITL